MKGMIMIVSGEGEFGEFSKHTGKNTARSINAALRQESCDGDRWAYACILSHIDEIDGVDADKWVGIKWDGNDFNGDYCLIPMDAI